MFAIALSNPEDNRPDAENIRAVVLFANCTFLNTPMMLTVIISPNCTSTIHTKVNAPNTNASSRISAIQYRAVLNNAPETILNGRQCTKYAKRKVNVEYSPS
uniref:Uncharacterized protein n=1 Tax=Arion vulgaris TaxID=1028688 RepID=A0A0B7A1G5_9EUPU